MSFPQTVVDERQQGVESESLFVGRCRVRFSECAVARVASRSITIGFWAVMSVIGRALAGVWY
ncbi:hypothetical protein ATN38_00640 [Rhodococcus sp. FH8]|jgi:phosphoglucomutase|uniref:Uncharacterized protein n=1 Tax=Rhodococcus erythropolis TaxID=1833 RepID=A0A6G9D396_RHOER|nr:hypothetical protein N601_31080 [Rhodococcus erythropolis DN1]MBW0282280.1 hypothetical protein [Rhodococcus sp. FH8]MBW0288587.1 hypothetical protein [Rhodococcus sp. MH15]QIP43765.1 hypothetical protein G9444_6522 [Rhodococcus erythropolis]